LKEETIDTNANEKEYNKSTNYFTLEKHKGGNAFINVKKWV
jgi:hypothetical protein